LKKIILTTEQISKVVALRESGSNWVSIEHDTGIPRRIALNTYIDWEHKRSTDELKEARREVAAAEFYKHKKSLIRLADEFVKHLDTPASPDNSVDAAQHLDIFWKSHLSGKQRLADITVGTDNNAREIKRMVRRNLILFQALKDHTHGEVNWRVLDEWKQAWDSCIALFPDFRMEVDKLASQRINNNDKLSAHIDKKVGLDDILPVWNKQFCRLLWDYLRTGDTVGKCQLSIAESKGKESIYVRLPDIDKHMEIPSTLRESSEDIVEIYNSIIKNIYKTRIISQLSTEINKMKKAAEEMEIALDSLVLSPLIVRTRCNLCPL
jgi:hypothetical protein